MRHRPQDSQPQHDLDSTDELPVLDEALAAAPDDVLSTTGEWPPLADADTSDGDLLSTTGEWPPLEAPDAGTASPSEDAIAALTTTLREKSFAIARLERDLETARAASQRQVRASPAELAILEQRLADVERERLALAAQHDDRRARLAAAEEALAAERTRHAVLEAAAHARIAEREAALLEAETRLAAESVRGEALQAEVERLGAELEARLEAESAARLQRDCLDAEATGRATEQASPSDFAREREQWRAREQERAAELRRVREELSEARLHVERLLEQLRSREVLGRYGDDFQAADATARRPAADPRPADAPAAWPEPAPAPASVPAPAPAARAVFPKRYLVRLDDPVAPLQVLGQERIRVGRTPDNDLRLDEDWMSRHHATLTLGPDATVVEDAGSTNGVFINGRRVRRELLRDGDELAFGKARFRFQVHRPGGARD